MPCVHVSEVPPKASISENGRDLQDKYSRRANGYRRRSKPPKKGNQQPWYLIIPTSGQVNLFSHSFLCWFSVCTRSGRVIKRGFYVNLHKFSCRSPQKSIRLRKRERRRRTCTRNYLPIFVNLYSTNITNIWK
jgi:hypothetical protein